MGENIAIENDFRSILAERSLDGLLMQIRTNG